MNELIIDEQNIENKIFTIRSVQVMIDRGLAELYDVESKRLNEQVKRNSERFPEKFHFRLTEIEKNELVVHRDRFKSLKHSTSLPYAFTEQGVSMLSAVLKSKTAVEVSIKIIDSFVNIRKFISSNAAMFQRFERVEQRLSLHDEKEVYHFGASLKDLGKKWFAVSKMDINSFEIVGRLKCLTVIFV